MSKSINVLLTQLGGIESRAPKADRQWKTNSDIIVLAEIWEKIAP